MARTMNEIKDGAGSWAHEMKNYEMEKRRVLDEGFLRPQAMKLTAGQMKSQERIFDPLLQRFRDHEVEYKQRVMEETERINHLNRAMDIQVVREQPHHILHHESKFEAIAPGQDPTRQPGKLRQHGSKDGSTFPSSQVDFNIISNLPHDVHHWNRPDERPRRVERSTTQRKIQANRIRDFNITNNRYHKEHEARTMKEADLTIAEAANKYMESNRFDPVTQQFNDPRDEETHKHCDDAREVEVRLRAEDKIPPSYKGRHTEFYDAVSHEVHNPSMVRYLDRVEKERKDRYRNRYIVEHNNHAQDMKGDHMREARKLNKVAPERFLEHDRGYDFITNRTYGKGPKEQVHFGEGYSKRRKTPWEEIEESHAINGRSASTPALASAAPVDRSRSDQPSASVPARSSRSGVQDLDGAASQRSRTSQRSQASQRSQTLSEAGSRAMSNAGSAASAAQFREPPGATRPIPRSQSTPNFPAPQLSSVPELSASAVQTMKMPLPASFGQSYTMAPPPAPALPGSPVGSVYSRPSAKPQ